LKKDNGAEINATNSNGTTPLSCAAFCGMVPKRLKNEKKILIIN